MGIDCKLAPACNLLWKEVLCVTIRNMAAKEKLLRLYEYVETSPQVCIQKRT
jgi:hypothetical protein